MKQLRRIFALSLKQKGVGIYIVGLLMLYAALAVHLSSFGAFWSGDSGARFAMIREWVEYGRPIHWHYSYADLDPTAQIHPLQYFIFHQSRSFCAMYEPLFPLACGILYRTFGFAGLSIIPVISGVITCVVVYATARRLAIRDSTLLLLVLGLGTPLMIYSVVFWDHVIMMLVAAASGYLMLCSLQKDVMRLPVRAGVILGLGVWIHELIIALFLATLLAAVPLLWYRHGQRLVIGLICGFTPLFLLWVGTNWLIYGTSGGPHLSANMGGNPSIHPFSIGLILDQQRIVSQGLEELIGTPASSTTFAEFHPELAPIFLVFGVTLIFYMLATSFFGIDWKFAPFVSLLAASLALYLVFHVWWAQGLFLATPILIPGLAVPWDAKRRHPRKVNEEVSPGRQASPTSLFYAWMSRATWFYILIVFLYPSLPGADWGSRYLLPVLPFLTLLSVYALEEQRLNASPKWRGLVVACVAALIGISVSCQLKGLVMVKRNIRHNHELIRRVYAVTTPVIVFDDIATPAELAAASLPQAQFTVRNGEDWVLFLKALRRSKVQEFTYIGPDMGAHHLTMAASDGTPGFSAVPFFIKDYHSFYVNRTWDDGEDLAFIKCALPPSNKQQKLH